MTKAKLDARVPNKYDEFECHEKKMMDKLDTHLTVNMNLSESDKHPVPLSPILSSTSRPDAA